MELLINLDEREREMEREMERDMERERQREREILALTHDIQKDQGSGNMSVEKQDGQKSWDCDSKQF